MLIFLFACMTQEKVETAIEEARACTQASDCVDVGTQCPFGCGIVVNKSEEENIRQMLKDYETAHAGMSCQYDCIAMGEISCEEGLCGHLPADTGN